MGKHHIKVKSVEKATHDVLRIKTEKPKGFQFKPGQATDVTINKTGWQDKKNSFTFTSLPDEDLLEFTIKTYPSHQGVTNELLNLKPNDELIISDAWGTINYKGEGVFIAGGAGVTPFISIFRHLQAQNKTGANKLVFANKTKADIINENEFSKMLGENFVNILSNEEADNYAHGYITKDFLKQQAEDLSQHFYVCGPQPMMDAIEKHLSDLGVNKELIVKEEF